MVTSTTPYFMWSADRNAMEMDRRDGDEQMMVAYPNGDDHHLPDHNGAMMMRKTEKKKRNKYGAGSAAEKKNKQPQRGLGVAQLEKLRLQERWKRMTSTTTLDHHVPAGPDSSGGLHHVHPNYYCGVGGGDIFGRENINHRSSTLVNSSPVGYGMVPLPMPWLGGETSSSTTNGYPPLILGHQRSQVMINNIIPYVQSSTSSSTLTTDPTFWRNYNPPVVNMNIGSVPFFPAELSSNQKQQLQYHHYADFCNIKEMAEKKANTGQVAVREYQLFPCGSYGTESNTSNPHDDAGERSNYAAYAPSKHTSPIDLTLKLNSY